MALSDSLTESMERISSGGKEGEEDKVMSVLSTQCVCVYTYVRCVCCKCIVFYCYRNYLYSLAHTWLVVTWNQDSLGSTVLSMEILIWYCITLSLI